MFSPIQQEPGCGKSVFSSAIAHEFGDCKFVFITAADINGKYIGESEKRLKALFSFASSAGRVVIVLGKVLIVFMALFHSIFH